MTAEEKGGKQALGQGWEADQAPFCVSPRPKYSFPFFFYWCSPGKQGVKTGLRLPSVLQNWPRNHPAASAEQALSTPQPLSPLWKLPEPPVASRAISSCHWPARHVRQRAAAIGAVWGSKGRAGDRGGALPQPLEPSGGEWTARRARPGQSGGTVRGGSIACPCWAAAGPLDTSAKHGLWGSVGAGAEVSRRTGASRAGRQ